MVGTLPVEEFLLQKLYGQDGTSDTSGVDIDGEI